MSEPNLTEKIDNNNETPSDNSNNNVEVNENTTVPKDETDVLSVSSASSVPKQSGIRPPSRIGRPCGGIQKPAIPATPTKNSPDDSMRRLTDDYGRHKLTDLLEADESEEDGLDYYLKSSARRNRYTSIGSTASSMDGLWELHPRRLSEAGLSRHSDSSAVLTEDTDSFIIGQRVWVGGTKPGTIAYIGETQFAPGEWAGIALDEPIGKNDGSVGGIRYFQCESKKGVFSRLTRLTRVPLEQPGMGSNETFISPNNGIRKSPISPTGSTRSLLRSAASLSNSNTSLNSSATHVDFKLGDRVIIKSTQGSKVGTVRYMGLTDFAPGEWVGVELDDPRGKNDGSVEGKRYFECRPNFGLFAPIAKVSKSPSKYKPSACVVHSGPGLPPSGLKRANSKESMTSMTSRTSVASSVRRVRLGVTSLTPKKVSPKASTPLPTRTALQDVLREKQQHIEQLLKERDLERAEITRAASQADEAEQRFYDLKREFEQYRAECEAKVRESGEVLAELKLDQAKVLSQLEDERRRNEDLDFKFEEAEIAKRDVEAHNENHAKKIEELEKALAEERHKAEALESTSNKLFEAEEHLIKARDEVDSLKSELSDIRQKRDVTEEEKTVTSSLVESLRKQLEGVAIENSEKAKTIDMLTEEISQTKSEHELVKRKIKESKKKSDDNCEEKDKLIEKLKMKLSSRSHDLEVAHEKLAAKDNEIKSLRTELEKTAKEMNEKTEQLNRFKSNSLESEEGLSKKLAEAEEQLKKKIAEIEELKEASHVKIRQKEQELEEKHNTIVKRSAEIDELSEKLNSAKVSYDDSHRENHERHIREIQSQQSQLMGMSAELQQRNEELMQHKIVINKLEDDLCTKNGIIEKLRLELEQYEKHQSEHKEWSSSMTAQFNELTMKNTALMKQFEMSQSRYFESHTLNERLQIEIQTLLKRCDQSEQLEGLRREIHQREELLVSVRQEFEQKLLAAEQQRQAIQVQYDTTISEFKRVRHELEIKIQTSAKSEDMLRQQCDSVVSELTKIRDESQVKISQLEQALQAKEGAISTHSVQMIEKQSYYEQRIKEVTEIMNGNVHGLQETINTLQAEITELKQQISAQAEQLVTANAALSHAAAEAQMKVSEQQQQHLDQIHRLEFEINEKRVHIEKLVTEMTLIRRDCVNTSVDIEGKNLQISELSSKLEQSQKIITQLQEQLLILQGSQGKSTAEYESLKSQHQSLVEQVAALTSQLRLSEGVARNLQVEYNSAMLVVNKLKITEQQKMQCLQQLQQELANKGDKQNCAHVFQLMERLKVEKYSEHEKTVVVLQSEMEDLRHQLAEQTYLFEAQKSELLHLQEELLLAQDCKGVTHIAKDESLIHDKELAENQIRFLNSIIVDIQKKNEEQQARIDILEAGYSPAMADDMRSLGPATRQVPPRMYCDICEEFDLHETEECPQQNSDIGLNDDSEYH